ncbi:efflux RND transporter periplasmic adaptor subunit [Aureimonas mangrovi]|uniref:efflux RND transporter periplasmic adaptor subunit n=1 Tax=Aureimonas mangrovi TaxID=2758041 RepID=UPI00163DD9EA|nr:efflux RND transporter periplasmic adaptor subunit [Aureimonas mangrovi]
MISKFLNATTLVFLAIVALVVFWIGSGMFGREPETPPQRAERALPSVAASASQASEVTTELTLYGDVEPTQIATVRARVEGVVEEVVSQGTVVAAGDVLARLSTDDRQARAARAQAQLTTAEQAAANARQLFERGVGPETNVQTTMAELEAARAELRAIELEIANTQVVAPIAGVVNRVIADLGAYVSPGGEVLEIVDNDPLLAVITVQQGDIARVRSGMPARVSFIGGDTRDGRVSFVSPIAEAATRTFRVEVEVANPDESLPSGISAEVVIPIETVSAHYISPALARLDTEGLMGVYVVDDADRIQFAPMEIVNADAGGIWITGIEDGARLVTISQGGLQPGEVVAVRETPAEYLRGEAGLDASAPVDAASSGGNGDEEAR